MKSNEVAQCTGDWEGVADWFAPAGSALSEEAKAICTACPFRAACATRACDEGVPFGVFGGMDEDDRQAYWGTDKTGRSLRPHTFDQSIHAVLKVRCGQNENRNVA